MAECIDQFKRFRWARCASLHFNVFSSVILRRSCCLFHCPQSRVGEEVEEETRREGTALGPAVTATRRAMRTAKARGRPGRSDSGGNGRISPPNSFNNWRDRSPGIVTPIWPPEKRYPPGLTSQNLGLG